MAASAPRFVLSVLFISAHVAVASKAFADTYAVTSVDADGGNVEISKIGGAVFPVLVEVETVRGQKSRQRVDKSKTVNQLTFGTSDSIRTVAIDPEGIYPDVDVSNNRWPQQVPKR